jgi:hypothetical protein
MAKGDKTDVKNAKRTAAAMQKKSLRMDPKAVKSYNKSAKAGIKAQKDGMDSKSARRGLVDKVSSSSYKFNSRKSVSPVKPSMPVKTGVKNKLKTQGKAATHSGKGYMRTGKK